MEQGIKSDYDLVVKRSSKSRVFMQNFDVEHYPFGCAQESPNRLGERELVYELLVAVYPKHCFEGVAPGDVRTAMAKTASTVHNDDPLRKSRLLLDLTGMRLARGTPFEEGARVLWEMVDDLEAMGVPVLGELEGFLLDKRKKEMLFTFISSNPDYEEVVRDYHAPLHHRLPRHVLTLRAAVLEAEAGGRRKQSPRRQPRRRWGQPRRGALPAGETRIRSPRRRATSPSFASAT